MQDTSIYSLKILTATCYVCSRVSSAQDAVVNETEKHFLSWIVIQ